jgi:hypothetical protein
MSHFGLDMEDGALKDTITLHVKIKTIYIKLVSHVHVNFQYLRSLLFYFSGNACGHEDNFFGNIGHLLI